MSWRLDEASWRPYQASLRLESKKYYFSTRISLIFVFPKHTELLAGRRELLPGHTYAPQAHRILHGHTGGVLPGHTEVLPGIQKCFPGTQKCSHCTQTCSLVTQKCSLGIQNCSSCIQNCSPDTQTCFLGNRTVPQAHRIAPKRQCLKAVSIR